MENLRATRALIHTQNLRHNIRAVRKSLVSGVAICASVKANAYGHGFKTAARIFRENSIECLGVATPLEGKQLRDAGDTGRVILYGPCSERELPMAVDAGLELMVTDRHYMNALIRTLENKKATQHPVHLKVDTGMGRVGFSPEETVWAARTISESRRLRLCGLATHFPVADSKSPEDMEFTGSQYNYLSALAEKIRSEGINPGTIHVANSGGIALHGQMNQPGMMVRPGIALYGYGPKLPVEDAQKPVMELRTEITSIKKVPAGTSISYGRTWFAEEDCWIATLPVGYADGYPRLLSNRGEVLISGKRFPLAGTICMDQCMVNLGPEACAAVGDEVILFGPDNLGPDAEELANLMGTISYEITCGISPRVPRKDI